MGAGRGTGQDMGAVAKSIDAPGLFASSGIVLWSGEDCKDIEEF